MKKCGPHLFCFCNLYFRFPYLWRKFFTHEPLPTGQSLYSQSHLAQPEYLPDHRQSGMTACPVCWAMGMNEVKQCMARKKIFCTRLIRAAKAGQKCLVLKRKAQRTYQVRTPLICTPLVPICLSFNSQQGPRLSSLSVCNYLTS